jgi:hypothetical protein
MKEALSFSETSVLTRVTRRNIPEDTNNALLQTLGTNLSHCTLSCYFNRNGDSLPASPFCIQETRKNAALLRTGGRAQHSAVCRLTRAGVRILRCVRWCLAAASELHTFMSTSNTHTHTHTTERQRDGSKQTTMADGYIWFDVNEISSFRPETSERSHEYPYRLQQEPITREPNSVPASVLPSCKTELLWSSETSVNCYHIKRCITTQKRKVQSVRLPPSGPVMSHSSVLPASRAAALCGRNHRGHQRDGQSM